MKYNLKQTAIFLCSLLMISQSCKKNENAAFEEEKPLTFVTIVNGVSYTVKSKSITGSIFKDNTPSKSVEINVGLDEKRTGLNFFFSLGWSINSDWSIEKRRKDFKYCPIHPEIS